jgi:hypothetical protein
MLALLQLLIAVFAIYSALSFEEEVRLLIPLGCLVAMFIVSRVDRQSSEKTTARKTFLKSEIDRVREKEEAKSKDQDFFTIESLLWPKSEILLIDAVHSVFKELGFKVSTGIHYGSVDRIVKIPDTQKSFGVEILMSEMEVAGSHPKINRALQFEKEKKEGEKTLIIGSTHIHRPLSERDQVNNVSPEMIDFLARHSIVFIPAYQLYQLWQRAKGGDVDIFGVFQRIHSQPGGIFSPKGI